MFLRGDQDKANLVKKIRKDINEDVLNNYWKGFKTVPFALYDDKKIYMAYHTSPPADFEKVGNIYIGPWRQEFYANTMISFEGKDMGIFNLGHLNPTSPYEKVYSITIHEMFHAYQLKVDFMDKLQSKYDEFMFTKYPFTKENIELRVIEREELLNAVFSHEAKLKEKHIGRFIAAREKRKALIGDLINYELGLESIEGTATYVEYQACIDKTNLPKKFILSKYAKNLAGYPKNFNNFRASCYSAGMFICLILDQANLHWQKDYLTSGELLYDYLLKKVAVPKQEIEINNLNDAEYLADKEDRNKRDIIDNFSSSKGYKLVIVGDMSIGGFNPMQVVPYEGHILHQTFLKVNTKSQSAFINAQCLAKHGENPWKIEEVMFFSNEKPILVNDMIKVKGLGDLKAKVEMNNNAYYIYLS